MFNSKIVSSIPKMAEKQELKYLVRIANTDLDGKKQIAFALRKIKGIDFMFANALCRSSGVQISKKAGYLTDSEVNKIEEIIKNPLESGVPSWLYNRKKDPESGSDKHFLTSELSFIQDNDIKMMKKVKTYKGTRHIAGLPARGQRTKSNFRKNKGKGSLGVKRRAGAKTGK